MTTEAIAQQDDANDPPSTPPKPKRGFATMDKRSLRKLARQGGQAAHAKGVAPTFTKETAREAGKKGGNAVAQDREHMREIGRKGGTSVSRDPEHMSRIGKVGGPIGAARRWGKDAPES